MCCFLQDNDFDNHSFQQGWLQAALAVAERDLAREKEKRAADAGLIIRLKAEKSSAEQACSQKQAELSEKLEVIESLKVEYLALEQSESTCRADMILLLKMMQSVQTENNKLKVCFSSRCHCKRAAAGCLSLRLAVISSV